MAMRWYKALVAIGILVLALPVAALGQQTGAVVTPIADVTVTGTATQIVGQNVFRTALSCMNNDATVNVRWGSSAVTATSGQRVSAGASVEILNRGPIFMISEGANVTVSCTEEGK